MPTLYQRPKQYRTRRHYLVLPHQALPTGSLPNEWVATSALEKLIYTHLYDAQLSYHARLEQNGRRFADNICKYILLKVKDFISI